MHAELTKAAEQLNEYYAELQEDGSDVWVSIPAGYNTAVEIDPDLESNDYAVTIRVWSPDHGLAHEEIMAEGVDIDTAIAKSREAAKALLKSDS